MESRDRYVVLLYVHPTSPLCGINGCEVIPDPMTKESWLRWDCVRRFSICHHFSLRGNGTVYEKPPTSIIAVSPHSPVNARIKYCEANWEHLNFLPAAARLKGSKVRLGHIVTSTVTFSKYLLNLFSRTTHNNTYVITIKYHDDYTFLVLILYIYQMRVSWDQARTILLSTMECCLFLKPYYCSGATWCSIWITYKLLSICSLTSLANDKDTFNIKTQSIRTLILRTRIEKQWCIMTILIV